MLSVFDTSSPSMSVIRKVIEKAGNYQIVIETGRWSAVTQPCKIILYGCCQVYSSMSVTYVMYPYFPFPLIGLHITWLGHNDGSVWCKRSPRLIATFAKSCLIAFVHPFPEASQ